MLPVNRDLLLSVTT